MTTFKIEVKDVSRSYRTYSRADGGGDDHWNEEYVVVCGDIELFRTPSRIEAERYRAEATQYK